MRADTAIEASGTVVLVEGESDRLAVEALAVRLEVDLLAAGAVVRSMSGVTNLHHHLAALAGESARRRVVGLFDAGEAAYVRRCIEDAGLGGADLESAGFFACEPDLEGEFIRALGSDRVEQLLGEHHELGRFRTFQNQPEWRGEPADAQLRRFMGTHAGRKARFAPLMVDALEESRIPAPMRCVIEAAVALADEPATGDSAPGR
ncbi:TOPRIM nucleotidyl transferase/hydrolase domain-containing protein [Agromyces laixinhei]|uniref:TOPRIM nucleotidyl transferase/hydrolase domain-containing protein n=1 Tax=Agromyces laixinhei TaxID=2585717 RepID=UPI0012EEC54E|nr:TOPRIM nucleotidyl transferase/hydrolase domain-containing protein [Agromyces laixinhei]